MEILVSQDGISLASPSSHHLLTSDYITNNIPTGLEALLICSLNCASLLGDATSITSCMYGRKYSIIRLQQKEYTSGRISMNKTCSHRNFCNYCLFVTSNIANQSSRNSDDSEGKHVELVQHRL